MKKQYEIITHGYEHSQYFQGCGTYGTSFDYAVTGCGMNAKEAYIDAYNQIKLAFHKINLPTRP